MKLLGNTAKDSNYLKLLNNLIASKNGHPKHNGVKMQAHHIISADGIKFSRLGSKLEEFGYDINLAPNLAFLPCTLQGACHLGVQPHRGNHTALSDRGDAEQEDYDDDEHPLSYHMLISKKVQTLKLPLDRACTGHDDPARHEVKTKMNELSESILTMICRMPNTARLTSIADHFSMGNKVGCSGVDSVSDHRPNHHCPTGRSHHGRQGQGQRNERISYVSKGIYAPNPGE